MKIALWRLGSLKHRIYPTAAAIEKFTHALKSVLEN